jgi:DNA-directed RNA polymerase subunit RPC12/RpoP
MPGILRVGSDIKYFCSRCGLELGHRILAMVGSSPARVRCNTCFSERNYKVKKEPKDILRAASAKPVRRTKVSDSQIYQDRLKANIMKTPKTYRATEPFELGDVVDHPSFGRGVVVKLIFPDRMDVLFPGESKTLVRASAPAE